MQYVRAAIVLLALLAGAGNATAAIDLTVTYTGDNVVSAFYRDGSSPQSLDISLNPNNATWWIADSATVHGLDYGTTYQFFFQVRNDGTFGEVGNPAGFLAEVKGDASGPLLTSGAWEYVVDPYGGLPGNPPETGWAAATEWAYQGTDSFNGGDNIWGRNRGVIAGISQQAHWIWGPHNGVDLGTSGYPDENYLWLRTTVVTDIPEPTTILIWTVLGIFGAVVYSRGK